MSDRGLKIFLIIAIFFGIAARGITYFYYQPEHGAVLQLAMAKSYQDRGEFYMEYGPIFEPCNTERTLSHHFPPLYPWVIAHTLKLANPDFTDFKILSFVLSLITIFLLYFMTRIVFTELAGLVLAAMWSLDAVFIDNASKCLGENLQVILLTIFLALLISSRKKPWFLISSGLVLGLAYLSKSTLPFWGTVIVVFIGALLLLYFKPRYRLYLITGFVLFFITIFQWGFRNYLSFHSFETSEYISSTLDNAFSSSLSIKRYFLIIIAVSINLLVLPCFFYHEYKKSRKLGFMNLVLIIFSLGAYLTAIIYSLKFAGRENYFDFSNGIRYTIPAFVPLAWLAFNNMDYQGMGLRRRIIALVVVLAFSSMGILVYAVKVDDKPLINEADIVLAAYVYEKPDLWKECLPVQFGLSINKNNLYYYYFKLCNAEDKWGSDIAETQFTRFDKRLMIIRKSDIITDYYKPVIAVDSSGKLCDFRDEKAVRILVERFWFRGKYF